ncbi:MAG: DUF2061 domain-containing protein, partial [Chitinophagaceae bacterium]
DTLIAKNVRKPSVNANSHLMSLVKGITWRIVGTIDTILIAWLVTGKIHMAVSIGSVEVFTKILLYYLHDRAWELAKKKKSDNQPVA